MQEGLKISVRGDVLIKDHKTGEILADKKNDIHAKNMATAIARGLANTANFQIFKLKLGNQGTYIDDQKQIAFRPANVTGDSADLYGATYVEIVDDADQNVGVGNSVTFTNIPGTTNTRVIITAIISSNEAVNNPTDTGSSSTDPEGQFFFDELGLFTKETSGASTDLNPDGELMLSHLIFSPIEHTGNRELTVIYSLTISVS